MGYYALSDFIPAKKVLEIQNPVQTEEASVAARPGTESTFFDPSGLISASQHGQLDTIQKGFSFTEGPAVDKQGNVYFTDQPNDKIYRSGLRDRRDACLFNWHRPFQWNGI